MTGNQLNYWKEKNPFASLTEIIYELLLDEILGFKIKPGEKLNESTIAEQLNISRSPVRNALQKLADDGYIQIKNSRYYISEFSYEEYKNVMDFALILESYAAGEAAVKITPKELDELYEMAYELQRVYRRCLRDNTTVSYGEILEAEHAFHCRIIEIANNGILTDVYNRILHKLFRYRSYLTYHPPAGLLSMIENDHIILCDILKLGDRELAQASIKHHLHITETFIVKNRILPKND